MDPIRQSSEILDRIYRSGGVIEESMLPYENDLIMFRLTNQEFIRPCGAFESGERIFALTDKGMEELQRHVRSTGH